MTLGCYFTLFLITLSSIYLLLSWFIFLDLPFWIYLIWIHLK